MIQLEKTAVFNLENAIRGARNPMNSWDKMDSAYDAQGNYILGEADLSLAQRLCRAGSDHRKFMRQILLSVDITAPLYWWKEYDTYKVGTTANSTSTMHKIHARPFERADFSHEALTPAALDTLDALIAFLEQRRKEFVQSKDKACWMDIIQLLPSGYNQTRTCTMSYENLVNMYHARKSHKLQEWHLFCAWVEGLPYAAELICGK